jgi:competence protein ComEC
MALGDLELEGQDRLLADLRRSAGGSSAAGSADRVDVVKVAHHGSAKQVAPLYRLLGARLALIGVGRANDYGHPAASALRMLHESGLRVHRTDQDGDIALTPVAGGGIAVATRPP